LNAILYYLANRQKMDDYIRQMEAEAEKVYDAAKKTPSELSVSLKRRIEELRKISQTTVAV
jgi:predicted transcriptional regulator